VTGTSILKINNSRIGVLVYEVINGNKRLLVFLIAVMEMFISSLVCYVLTLYVHLKFSKMLFPCSLFKKI